MNKFYHDMPKGCLPIITRYIGLMILTIIGLNFVATVIKIVWVDLPNLDYLKIIVSFFFYALPLSIIGLLLVNLFPTIYLDKQGILIYGLRYPLKRLIYWENIYGICEIDLFVFKGFYAIIFQETRNKKWLFGLICESLFASILGFSHPVILLSPKFPGVQKIISTVGLVPRE